MAIEISPRRKIKMTIWEMVAGIVLAILFVVLLASYFYFFFTIKKMNQQIQEKEAAVIPLEKAIKEKEEELIPLSQKINGFNQLLAEHKTPLNIFELLERVSLPKVWFSEFDFNSDTKEVTVSGKTNTFTVLEQQISVLKQEPLLQNLNITEVSILMKEEGIKFTFSLFFNPSILQ